MRGRFVALVALAVALGQSGGLPARARAAVPTIWTWPGCAAQQQRSLKFDTLQNCIDGATAGDSVTVATSSLVPEFVSIGKSLTLDGSAGSLPTLEGIAVSTPTAAPVVVAISNLTVERQIRAIFSLGAGHRLAISGVSVTPGQGNPIDLEASVPTTISLIGSQVAIAGSEAVGVYLDASQAAPGLVTFSIIGNRISGHRNAASGSGIELDLGGTGTTRADLMNNAVWDVGRCFCGVAAGIALDAEGSPTARVNVVGNTLERSRTEGLYVRNDLAAGGQLALDAFNNIVSHAAVTGIDLDDQGSIAARLSFAAGDNDSYGNGAPDLLDGHAAGDGNLSVLPGYANPLKGDLRLGATSALINQGLVCSPGGVAQPDAAGVSRLAGPSVDLGAYEYGAGPITGIVRLGTNGNDVLSGSSGNDILCGYDGNDRISGMAGNDYIDGGNGNDLIDGGAGNDILLGGAGNDKLIGDSGADHLYGGPGNDTLCARDGVHGNDHLDGGPGSDGYQADRGDHLTGVEHTATC